MAEYPLDEPIGALIRRVREQRCQTQRALAEDLHAASGTHTLTWNDIARWERGKRVPGPYWRRWLSQVSGLPRSVLDRAAVEARQQREASRLGFGQDAERRSVEEDEDSDSGRAAVASWPQARLVQPVPDLGADWHLTLPGGRVLDGSIAAVQVHPAVSAPDGCAIIEVTDLNRLDQFLRLPRRGLLVAKITGNHGEERLFGLDAREARRQLVHRPSSSRPTLVIPAAYELDELTGGVLWSVANFDDGLLVDEVALSESRQQLSAYERLPGSAVSREAAAGLTAVSRMWLGSDFCARHIVRNAEPLTERPLFWTREQRGEEASAWLVFHHKYAYLRTTVSQFRSSGEPLVRAFCVPEAVVRDSPVSERLLLFLSMALMESLGILVQVCVEPDYSNVEGFVLAPAQRAVIANWIRADGIWHVDTTDRRSILRDFTEVAGHARAHSIVEAPTPPERLARLAEYLGLDWSWLRRRCAQLAECGWAGLVQPRSRLLSLTGLDTVCAYAGGLRQPEPTE